MAQYNIKCPVCGHINKNLLLYETEGRYICEHCKHEEQLKQFIRPETVPAQAPKQAV